MGKASTERTWSRHIRNSRLTDPEVLGGRYPARLESYEIRPYSGGPGHWHRGKGSLRKIRSLEKMTISIIWDNQRVPPFGTAGGESGACGRH